MDQAMLHAEIRVVFWSDLKCWAFNSYFTWAVIRFSLLHVPQAKSHCILTNEGLSKVSRNFFQV